MKIINLIINNRKRAVSPVIAVILLIGLAVAAAAAIFIVVIPLLQPTTSLEIINAYVLYDTDHTTSMDEGIGYGMGYVGIANVGTGEVDVTNISIYYFNTTDGTWIPMADAYSMEGIDSNNPWTISVTGEDTLRVRFIIPELNYDNDVVYRITTTPEEGRDLDTIQSDEVDELDMELSADRPQISYTRTLGTIRRTTPISPTSVTDNSQVKRVSYEFFNAASDRVLIKNITSSTSWSWQWNTYNSSNEGLNNSDYTMKMTVYDYAGLSNYIWENDSNSDTFTIDNDYVDPHILGAIGSSVNGEGIAEVGEFYPITANIDDIGSGDSGVESAYIYYKTNSSGDLTYIPTLMNQGAGNTWTGNIPGPYIGNEALRNNLTFYITATDLDGNSNTSIDFFADVNDSTEPNFVEHNFEGESVISIIDPLSGDESQTISISATVEDKNFVTDVTLVWRERNDTTLLIPDPWRNTFNISGTGETWEFHIPALNVTLDGLEYYFIAVDNDSNVAYEGNSVSPYRITVTDLVAPEISLVDGIPSEITGGSDLIVTAIVSDNDPTFSWTGNERGTVELGYRRMGLDADYIYIPMDHKSGDSSQGGTAIWEGTIGGGNFTTSFSPILLRIRATDYSNQAKLLSDSIDVIASGIPSLRYVADSVSVSGASDHILSFNIENIAGGAQPATAIIESLIIDVNDNTKDPYIGNPLIIQINASGGTNPLWENSSNPSEGEDNQKIDLTNTSNLVKGGSSTFYVVYGNSSGGYFNVNDLTMNITIYYQYSGPTYDYETLDSFDTPITTFQDYTETRYMRSDIHTINGLSVYNLGTTSSASSLENNQQTDRWSGSFTVTWGIRVWKRHVDTSEEEITLGAWVATVQRSSDGAGIQTNSWSCPQEPLVDTDAIVIRVYMQIGSTSYNPTEFITEQLGASQLNAASWTISYYTERDYRGWPQQRTRGIFTWGDATHDSRITNFQYRALGGGGGSGAVTTESVEIIQEIVNPVTITTISEDITPITWKPTVSRL
ncbi:MAG: archaellin/type IV pilin N-terminal domain-containing protein, partial [Candidatus Kariarchaeaceae archaeon]